MMASNATIKAIDSSTVHQIQSGQVIVDLCSVAKELVENSIDAGATAIEVRFKNQGLDSIEVQDNGSGIAPHNHESIALKHYTSKLSSYDDLTELQTFGFRGEALSSLCALSRFSVVTCTQQEAPRATRLEFEASGKIMSTSVVSGQRGTTVIVEDLFRSLPVRRRELERNIKREWGKVIGLLNQYACVQTGVKFTVSQQPTKGKRMVLFSTKGNATTRENIINVFGVKTMSALIPMDLRLELVPTTGPLSKGKTRADGSATEVRVLGHISRPAHGGGRQTPDRQMFYVNGRPCGLPQFSKVFNEVYRSYNASQSPFIFADIQLDTHLYDVNVSPDKRTILLHDQGQMLDNLREALIELFEKQDVTIPVSQAPTLHQTPFKPLAGGRLGTPASTQTRNSRAPTEDSRASPEASSPIHRGLNEAEEEESERKAEAQGGRNNADESEQAGDEPQLEAPTPRRPAGFSKASTLLSRWVAAPPDGREHSDTGLVSASRRPEGAAAGEQALLGEGRTGEAGQEQTEQSKSYSVSNTTSDERSRVADEEMAHGRLKGRVTPQDTEPESSIPAIPPPSQPSTVRSGLMATTRPPKRSAREVATITIGDHTVTSVFGNLAKRSRLHEAAEAAKPTGAQNGGRRNAPLPSFGGRLSQLFSASARREDGSVDTVKISAADSEEDDAEAAGTAGGEDSLFVAQAEDEDVGSVYDDEITGETEEQASEREEPEAAEAASEADAPLEAVETTSSSGNEHAVEDGDYVDDDEKKAREDEKVQEMIDAAEAAAQVPTEEGEQRSRMFVKGRGRRKDMTFNLVQEIKTTGGEIRQRLAALASQLPQPRSKTTPASEGADGLEADDAEEKLSLKISKSDFAKMRIVGQFNLGFILAVREAASASTRSLNSAEAKEDDNENDDDDDDDDDDDELFIIDQHASDEKYNFERLQATTTVQSQRLVQPKTLELTALEEEIILEHQAALERNGFLVRVDTSGRSPVGSRVQLLSLPLSRETTFSVADLEELVFLLADNPTSSAATVPRPGKVRRMLAMRACRSSIMIGRALSRRQMERVVRHMGEMEKPWNCPHGRPTMRHLCGLGGAWDGGRGWEEGEAARTDWAAWARERRRSG